METKEISNTNIKLDYKDLLDAGVHFGHLTRKWDPKMAPYIFMERNGIHIIDLNKTIAALEDAIQAMKDIVREDGKILFVATKKQAQEVVTDTAKELNMPFVTDRWLGGMMTNFATIRRSLTKMSNLEKHMKEDSFQNLAKRERLMKMREYEKQQRIFGGIQDLTRLPQAMFVVDVMREHIAVKEANKLGIPVFAMVDTNSDPRDVDYPIPANDDAFKSINFITGVVKQAIEEAQMERQQAREANKDAEGEKGGKAEQIKPEDFAEAAEDKPKRRRKRKTKIAEKVETAKEGEKTEAKEEEKEAPKAKDKKEPEAETKTQTKAKSKKEESKKEEPQKETSAKADEAKKAAAEAATADEKEKTADKKETKSAKSEDKKEETNDKKEEDKEDKEEK